jgi:hypothetical protein
MYYVTTQDFRNFSPTRLFYDHGFNVIDATINQTGDKYIMFLKDESNKPFTPQKNIRVATAVRAQGPYSPPSPPITGDYWAEGPSALRLNGQWHVYFDKYRQHQYGLVVSDDLVNWQDWSDRIRFPDGCRHGSILAVPKESLTKVLALKQN